MATDHTPTLPPSLPHIHTTSSVQRICQPPLKIKTYICTQQTLIYTVHIASILYIMELRKAFHILRCVLSSLYFDEMACVLTSQIKNYRGETGLNIYEGQIPSPPYKIWGGHGPPGSLVPTPMLRMTLRPCTRRRAADVAAVDHTEFPEVAW